MLGNTKILITLIAILGHNEASNVDSDNQNDYGSDYDYDYDFKGDIKCGRKSHKLRIISGTDARLGEFPWMASIVFHSASSYMSALKENHCGGALVNQQFVLTAAHCLAKENVERPDQIYVTLGEHDRTRDTSNTLKTRVSKFIMYPRYQIMAQNYLEDESQYDLALLKLSEPVPWKLYPNIRPVCLPGEDDDFYWDEKVTVVGWGVVDDEGTNSATLQTAKLVVYNDTYCAGLLDQDTLSPLKLCAGSDEQSAEEAKDSCANDSGGPLLRLRESSDDGGRGRLEWQVIGVVSYGIGEIFDYSCGTAGIYVKVSKHLQWIQQTIDKYSTEPENNSLKNMVPLPKVEMSPIIESITKSPSAKMISADTKMKATNTNFSKYRHRMPLPNMQQTAFERTSNKMTPFYQADWMVNKNPSMSRKSSSLQMVNKNPSMSRKFNTEGGPRPTNMEGDPRPTYMEGVLRPIYIEGDPRPTYIEGDPRPTYIEGDPRPTNIVGGPRLTNMEGYPRPTYIEGVLRPIYMVGGPRLTNVAAFKKSRNPSRHAMPLFSNYPSHYNVGPNNLKMTPTNEMISTKMNMRRPSISGTMPQSTTRMSIYSTLQPAYGKPFSKEKILSLDRYFKRRSRKIKH